MAKSRRRYVLERAQERCEYCQLPQANSVLPHEVDHIRAQKHLGRDDIENLCLGCAFCNAFKGTNVAGYDPESGGLVALFNPRQDAWRDHFLWRRAMLVGKTASARATIDVLRINDPDRVAHRQSLISLGVFPLTD